ncbi:hypothetical protein JCM17846_26200 [Iodidimonas nitroreducens]|uniref:Uncharacterized protein n=1 Tax=Iodidimonas nitroreducens TaxID=1236968 RepID=A0A5A7NA02_9PROT|nr:hypothetical protein JCM17846_26200 [Iodidimonas nitroreducens]
MADFGDIGIAEHGLQKIRLIDQIKQRLAGARIIKGRMQMVHPQHALGAQGIGALDPQPLAGEHGQKFRGRIFHEIDLATGQGQHRRLRITDIEPFDGTHPRDFAPGHAIGGFGARDIGIIAAINDLAAGDPFFGDEPVRA